MLRGGVLSDLGTMSMGQGFTWDSGDRNSRKLEDIHYSAP